jgi:hypothetical protein
MMSNAKYETVPDVESPVDHYVDYVPPSDVIIAKAQARYPEAGTKVEAEFLGRLDDAIDNAQPNITIPRVSADQIQPSTEITDYKALFKALKRPTLAFAAMIVTALIVEASGSPLAKAIYPYFACVITFSSSIPDIRKRFLTTVEPVFERLSGMKEKLEKGVERVSTKGFKYLSITKTTMNAAIAPIKDKIAFATKVEAALKHIDPNIDIPDTADIEDTFNGFESNLEKGFDRMQQVVVLSRDLPKTLQSIEKYQLYILVPFLAVMLGLQLWGVYAISHRGGDVPGDRSSVSNAVRLLIVTFGNSSGLEENAVVAIGDVRNTSVADINEVAGPVSEETPGWIENRSEILTAFQAYVTTVVQIVLAFLITQASVMAILINSQISILERRVNRELRKEVGDVFDDIFKKGFGMVKQKFLVLIRKLDKIEGPINQVKSKIPGGGDLPSSFMSSIPRPTGSFLGMLGKK